MIGSLSIVMAIIIAAVTYRAVQRWNAIPYVPRPQWIILYACSLQLIWGVQLIVFGWVQIASWSGFMFINPALLGVIFIASSASAFIGLQRDGPILFMLPQQGVMMAAAIGAVTMLILGRYADGVVRPRAFIFADQLPGILTAIWHTAAIFYRERARLTDVYSRELPRNGILSGSI